MRTGPALAPAPAAPAVPARSFIGESDSNAGNARQAPSPRRKWRRVKLAWRSAAVLRFGTSFIFMAVTVLSQFVALFHAVPGLHWSWTLRGRLLFAFFGRERIRSRRAKARMTAPLPG